MHELKQNGESVEIRIELRIFFRHFIKFCLQRIMATLREFLMMDTKTVKAIWKKFQQLKFEKLKRSQTAVLNLTGKDVDENIIFLVKYSTIFCLSTKFCTVHGNGCCHRIRHIKFTVWQKYTSAKSLPQTVSKILSKTIGKKQQDHLSKTQRTALKKTEKRRKD